MIMVAGTLYYVVVLFVYGVPDVGPLLTGYLGILLYGSATLAIGLMASALTPNQLVALVVGAGLLTAFTVIDFVSQRVSGVAAQVVDGFQLGSSFSTSDPKSFGVAEGGHFADFARGILSPGDIAYYISLTVVFLFLTVMLLEMRRWR
jgi:ABC-2 type transport system permease protein